MRYIDPIKNNMYNYSRIIDQILKPKNIIKIEKNIIKSHKESQQIHRNIISYYLKNIEKNIKVLKNICKEEKLSIIDIYTLVLELLDNKSNKILININSKINDKSINRFKLRRNIINIIITEIKLVLQKQKLLKGGKSSKINMLKTIDYYLKKSISN
jgi:hypothetical protein